jgi:hypothetical protein
MEVLMLPLLVHLFGAFELPAELGDARREDKLRNFSLRKVGCTHWLDLKLSKTEVLNRFCVTANH